MSRILWLAVALAAASCSKSSTQPPPAAHDDTVKIEKDPAAAKKLISEGAPVIDVRTPDEYAGDHLPNATNIPVDQIGGRMADVDKLVGGDKTKPIVVHCAKGGRAQKAKQQLEAAGYTHVVNGGGLYDLK